MKPSIDNLLARYWSALTTPDEEEQLRQTFAQGHADPRHEPLAPLFLAQRRLRQARPSPDFNQRVLSRLHAPTPRRHPLLRLAAPLLRAAAIVAIVATLGHALRHTLLRDNHADTLVHTHDSTTLQVSPGTAITEAPAGEQQFPDSLPPQPREP